jgi:hypothetical protein
MSEAEDASFFERHRSLAAVSAAMLVAALDAAYIVMPKRSVSTDNAYLQG